ncbi:MAG: AMP-binding protein [Streptosporangiales bacterium]|nr:AMP-binding protein [Streptosporangiales bacterium]
MDSWPRYATAAEAVTEFSWDRLWAAFDGNQTWLNIAHECLDRHPAGETAARIAFAGGRYDEPTFGDLSRRSAQFAHYLAARGIGEGDRVGVMMEPSREFYAALFGVIKRGAVAVPLYTLFGPEALRDRLDDCHASCVIVDATTKTAVEHLDWQYVVFDDALTGELDTHPSEYRTTTKPDDTAVLQYTSGTTRQLPEAVRHEHRSVVTLMRAALFGSGIVPGDRFFCPSSPAWGHGLWHGTIAPWSLGVAVGAWSGRFAPDRLIDALVHFRITNLAAASTIYRMILRSGRAGELRHLVKASYTGEELDAAAQLAFTDATGVAPCGIYGTTETGVIVVNFPGFPDHEPRPGALGKPMPGCRVTVLGDDDTPAAVGVTGEISVFRRGGWLRAKDLGSIDADGYLHYAGRADDVIISSGWTISPLEVERVLLTHPQVTEVAVVGVPDETRGHIVKAFVVASGTADEQLVTALQHLVKTELSPHEYPRQVEFVTDLPKTPNGKTNRRALRDAEAGAAGVSDR